MDNSTERIDTTIDEDIRRIAERTVERRKADAERKADDQDRQRAIAEKQKDFLNKAVVQPFRGVLARFKKHGIGGDVSVAEDQVTAFVDKLTFTIGIEFHDGEATAYAISDGSSGPLRGQSAEAAAKLFEGRFVSFLDHHLK